MRIASNWCGGKSNSTVTGVDTAQTALRNPEVNPVTTKSENATATIAGLPANNGQQELLQTSVVQNQIFYGTWKIVSWVPAQFNMPSSLSGFDENGNFRGPDPDSLLGETIEFQENSVIYSGKKHPYAFGPYTFALPLLSGNDQIGYSYAKTLGLTGGTYSTVLYATSDNWEMSNAPAFAGRKMHLWDLNQLYIKDRNTIYATGGGLSYLLKRIAPATGFQQNSPQNTSAQNRVRGLPANYDKQALLQNTFTLQNQTFYGTWEIVDCLIPDANVPAAYADNYTASSDYGGGSYANLLRKRITFQQDYVAYEGEKYPYAFGPYTFTLPLSSGKDFIGYYRAESLGLIGGSYSTVQYATADNFELAGRAKTKNGMSLADLNQLYPKDSSTMFASDGTIMYVLKKIGL
ncbi:MAG: hypothetical protein FWD65_05575 [Coriobacteriia bacterium]|nr:hypothetical protein [Coriobacteriia bacterium]